jgi:hypothetical protein
VWSALEVAVISSATPIEIRMRLASILRQSV